MRLSLSGPVVAAALLAALPTLALGALPAKATGVLPAAAARALPEAAPAPAAHGVTVTGASMWLSPAGDLRVVSEVQAGSEAVEGVRVTVAVLDAAGTEVGTSTAYSTVGVLAPGSRSPVDGIVHPAPAGRSSVRVTGVTALPATHAPSSGFALAPRTPGPGSAAAGTVTSGLTYPVNAVKVIGTFYDAAGTPVWTSYDDAKDPRYNTRVEPGQTLDYGIQRDEGMPAFTRSVVVAEADEPGAPLGAVPSDPAGAAPALPRHTGGAVGLRPVDRAPVVDPAPAGVRPTTPPAAPPARHDAHLTRAAGSGVPAPYVPLSRTAAPVQRGPATTNPLGAAAVLAIVVGVGLFLRRLLA